MMFDQEEFDLFYSLLTPKNEADIVQNVMPDFLRKACKDPRSFSGLSTTKKNSTKKMVIELAEQCAAKEHVALIPVQEVLAKLFYSPSWVYTPPEQLHKKAWLSFWGACESEREPMKQCVGFNEAVAAINLVHVNSDKL